MNPHCLLQLSDLTQEKQISVVGDAKKRFTSGILKLTNISSRRGDSEKTIFQKLVMHLFLLESVRFMVECQIQS